jgi:hypothetical protein
MNQLAHIDRPAPAIRRWMLGIKIIFVSLYLGGLAAVTVIWLSSGFNALPMDDPRRAWLLDLVGLLMVKFVVPCLIVVLILGAALLGGRPRELLRMRWLQVKLLAIVILIPSGHLWCRARVTVLRNPAAPQKIHQLAARGLSQGLVGTLVGSIVIVALGRIKPRFGQTLEISESDR